MYPVLWQVTGYWLEAHALQLVFHYDAGTNHVPFEEGCQYYLEEKDKKVDLTAKQKFTQSDHCDRNHKPLDALSQRPVASDEVPRIVQQVLEG